MWIKICGNTSLHDALRAAEAGADAVGYVFASSPRQMLPDQTAVITPKLPFDVTQVGVFVTHDSSEIAAAIRTAGLHGAQLHGGLDLPLVENLRFAYGDGFFLVQTLHWVLDVPPAEAAQSLLTAFRAVSRQAIVDAILIDARTGNAAGGTGKTIPWERVREALALEPAWPSGPRIILAGGLTPENVDEAIRTFRPWGVDVASGVESSPGKKDPARVTSFIRNARTAFAAIENISVPIPR